jgi:hypothetical protein
MVQDMSLNINSASGRFVKDCSEKVHANYTSTKAQDDFFIDGEIALVYPAGVNES